MPDRQHPVVTVGLPVYNGERSLHAAIQSVLSQTFADLELVISDNCSSDGTESICLGYAATDRRVRYERQSENVGASKNFRSVLDRAQGRYFIWAAADDVRSPDFLQNNIEFLELHEDYVASTCPDILQGLDSEQPAVFSLTGSPSERFRQFFAKAPRSHGIFYSVIRTDVIRECTIVGESFFAADWAIVLFLASKGNIHRTLGGWAEFGSTGASSRPNVYKLFSRSPIDTIVPYARFSAYVLKLARRFPLSSRISLVRTLAALNLRGVYDHAFSALYQIYKAKFRSWVRGR